MTSKKLGALLRSAPPATAQSEAAQPAGMIDSVPERPVRSATPAAVEQEVPLQVLVPERVRRLLAVKAAEEGLSLRALMLIAIRNLGIDVSDEEIKGKRGRKSA